jgi:hypothetical protein
MKKKPKKLKVDKRTVVNLEATEVKLINGGGAEFCTLTRECNYTLIC